VVFRAPAGGVHFDEASALDFREELGARLAPGDVVYELFARSEGSTAEDLIARIRLESRLVASSFGDRRLHFGHTRVPGFVKRT
jgi:hypothetical protein